MGLGVDSVNHLLYAVGGATGAPDDKNLDLVDVYDPATDSWTHKRHLNTRRGAPAVAAVNGKIYAIGGKGEHGPLDTVEVFDPEPIPGPQQPPGCRIRAYGRLLPSRTARSMSWVEKPLVKW